MSALRVAVAFYRTLASQSSASLTAGYLAAHLRAAGHEVLLVPLEQVAGTDDLASVRAWAPDVFFYKVNFKDLDRLEENLAAAGAAGIPVCLVGPFPVLHADAILAAHPEARAVLLPHHESRAAAGLDWLRGASDAPPADGFAFRGESGVTRRQAPEDALHVESYRVWPARDVEVREPIRIVNLEASRGCLRGCTFCHLTAMGEHAGAKLLRRPPADVVAEMRALHDIGKRYFIFNDSVFGGGAPDSTEWLREFCTEAAGLPPDVFFMAYFTLNHLDRERELISDLSGAGLIRVFVGLESATDVGNRRFRKGIRVENYREVKRLLRAQGVVPHIGFMLFHPFATPDELVTGLDFLLECDELHRFGVILEPARLVPGTLLMEQARDAGLLTAGAYAEVAHGYCFANAETQAIHDRFQEAFRLVDVPLLERIEHLFVTGEFIDNLIRRLAVPDAACERAAASLRSLRAAFASCFRAGCETLVNGGRWGAAEVATYQGIWEAVEERWQDLFRAAGECGLEDPLSWVPTGDLSSETSRPQDYDGRLATTRSGAMRLATMP